MFYSVFLTRLRNLLLLFTTATIIVSCGTGSTTSETQESTEAQDEIGLEEEITKVDIAKEDFERMLNTIPEPTKVPVVLQSTGAEYDMNLLNPVTKAKDYMTTNDKAALNLGVYSADLGYLCAYSKAQDAINYLNSSQNLVEYLNISNAIQMSISKRFEANLSNKDSLISIANQSIELAKDYLNESERFGTAALVATGSYVEGLYISTSLVENYPADASEAEKNEQLKSLVKTILEQKEPLGDLVNVLDVLGDSEASIVEVKDQVSDLFDMFDVIGIQAKLESNPDELLTDKTLKDITAKVAEIRNGIIE
ncbi:MAG: hypothetical protein CMO01_21705 [Thalassobius sp.]|nr:hypothetical protein [Thalassovita sp.]